MNKKSFRLLFASAILIALIIIVLNSDITNSGLLAIIRFLAAIFAGICGYLFSGNLGLTTNEDSDKLKIQATGGFAAFIITLFLFFIGLPSPDEVNQNELSRKTVNFIENDFQSIKVIETGEFGWEDMSGNLNKYIDCINHSEETDDYDKPGCSLVYRSMVNDYLRQGKYMAFGLAQENPIFDIIFVNNYAIDLTITKIGVEIVETRKRIWFFGMPEPQTINVAEKYSLTVPDNICPSEAWETEEPKCNVPKLIEKTLDNALFLTPGTAFRYNFELKKIGEYTPNATLLRFYLYTNSGPAYSSLVYVQQ